MSQKEFFSPFTLGKAAAALQHGRKFPWSWSPPTTYPHSLNFESCGKGSKSLIPGALWPSVPSRSSLMTPVPDPGAFIAVCGMFSLLITREEVTWAPLNLWAMPVPCLHLKGRSSTCTTRAGTGTGTVLQPFISNSQRRYKILFTGKSQEQPLQRFGIWSWMRTWGGGHRRRGSSPPQPTPNPAPLTFLRSSSSPRTVLSIHQGWLGWDQCGKGTRT